METLTFDLLLSSLTFLLKQLPGYTPICCLLSATAVCCSQMPVGGRSTIHSKGEKTKVQLEDKPNTRTFSSKLRLVCGFDFTLFSVIRIDSSNSVFYIALLTDLICITEAVVNVHVILSEAGL